MCGVYLGVLMSHIIEPIRQSVGQHLSGVACLVDAQLICNHQVVSSTLTGGSILDPASFHKDAGFLMPTNPLLITHLGSSSTTQSMPMKIRLGLSLAIIPPAKKAVYSGLYSGGLNLGSAIFKVL